MAGVRAVRASTESAWWDRLFLKAVSKIRPRISLRFRSCDVCTEANSLSLAFFWALDKVNMGSLSLINGRGMLTHFGIFSQCVSHATHVGDVSTCSLRSHSPIDA